MLGFMGFLLVAASASILVLIAMAVLGYRARRDYIEATEREAKAILRKARIEAGASKRGIETEGREAMLEERSSADKKCEERLKVFDKREGKLNRQSDQQGEHKKDLEHRRVEVDGREKVVRKLKDRAKGLRKDTEERRAIYLQRLEERAGIEARKVCEGLSAKWIEDVQAEASHRIRALEQGLATEHENSAKRVMEIAISRYSNHFLTERSISRIPITSKVLEILSEKEFLLKKFVEEASNITLNVNEEEDSLRLEGLDGVGREVARRALNRLHKRPNAARNARENPEKWAKKIRENLEREIFTLGKRAFSVLKIKRPHEEIVELVGALNYRTSYTQNQWLHAVEASFLAGMMASELGLNVRLARRATLMHDIGKALTHKIDGSHAVIGAEIARRRGEDELVANAIGAHHLDEPMNSSYAFLVAAADAMRGARPGARREIQDDYGNRLHELEKIGKRQRGVDRAFAVHGGRELRVYVKESAFDDLGCVDLSTAIAEQVSEEMVFPGQIKVTVIREYEAVTTAN